MKALTTWACPACGKGFKSAGNRLEAMCLEKNCRHDGGLVILLSEKVSSFQFQHSKGYTSTLQLR